MELYPVARLAAVAEATARNGLDALLLTPGPDLRYVTGYDATQLERLTCLVVPAEGDPFLVVPRLELPAAEQSPASRLGIEFVAWDETDDPYALVAARLGDVERVGARRPDVGDAGAAAARRHAAGPPGARRDGAARAAHAQEPGRGGGAARGGRGDRRGARAVPDFLKPGRTEREVARDIAAAIVEAGHVAADS